MYTFKALQFVFVHRELDEGNLRGDAIRLRETHWTAREITFLPNRNIL